MGNEAGKSLLGFRQTLLDSFLILSLLLYQEKQAILESQELVLCFIF